jgi:RNA polymerase sigma-70 factor (ECF subfamily)
MIHDDMLVEQCRRGDSSAMERLILKYQHRLYNVILKICANSDDAAELTQETFVKIIENINKFQGKSSFYTWAFRIAVNVTLNYCQRQARMGVLSLDISEEDVGEHTRGILRGFLCDDRSPDPAVMAQNKELCDIVTGSLIKLDEAHRAIIVLRDIEGMSYSEIASVLNIEIGTVRSRLSRARHNLREILESIVNEQFKYR